MPLMLFAAAAAGTRQKICNAYSISIQGRQTQPPVIVLIKNAIPHPSKLVNKTKQNKIQKLPKFATREPECRNKRRHDGKSKK